MILTVGTTPTMQRTMTFDRLRLDHVNRSVVTDEYASGKGVNVARVAAQLGADVVATGFAGGERGKALLSGMRADGVRQDFVRVAAETRLCTTVIDRAKGTVTELVEESRAVGPADWVRLLRVVRKHLKVAKVCVLSGSLPPGGDEDFYRKVAELAAAAGVRTIIDARGRPLLRAIGTPGLIVKLNREELAATVGRPLRGDPGLKRAMREVCPVGGQVIVTMGKDGAAAWDGERFWRIPAPKIAVVNPIGSGDAFAAGVAFGVAAGRRWKDAAALGAACGAANALHARAGHLSRQVVEGLLRKATPLPW
ncbi:MAG TPA: hexose kinase [Humisphaera sp.]